MRFFFLSGYGFLRAAADSFDASLVMREGEAIHDFCWYPYMSAAGVFLLSEKCCIRKCTLMTDDDVLVCVNECFRSGDQCFRDDYSRPSDTFMGCNVRPGNLVFYTFRSSA